WCGVQCPSACLRPPPGPLMDLLTAAAQGFETVDADPAFWVRAREFLGQWLTGPEFTAYRPQIEWQITAGKWADLLDAFYQVLPFGTGGRRGAGGVGPHRMNLWAPRASLPGHREYRRARLPATTDLPLGPPLHVRPVHD